MARQKLKQLGSQERFTFIGEFVRTGFKAEYNHRGQHCKPTLLLRNLHLQNNNEIITDHLWFNYGKNFMKLGWLQVGDLIQFNARVDDYMKGFRMHNQHDYKLSRPTKIKRISDPQLELELPMKDPHAMIGMILVENQKFYRQSGRGTDDDRYYIDAYKGWCLAHHYDWEIVKQRKTS